MGKGSAGFTPDGATAANSLLNYPLGLFANGATLLFGDFINGRVRQASNTLPASCPTTSCTSTQEFDVDYNAGDLPDGCVRAGSPGECCALCINNAACKAW